jgi:hypothetical protein
LVYSSIAISQSKEEAAKEPAEGNLEKEQGRKNMQTTTQTDDKLLTGWAIVPIP